MTVEDAVCSICGRPIDVNKEHTAGRPVWQYVEGYVPVARPGKTGGVNRIRLVEKHPRFGHDKCVKERRRVTYG